jgi:hypothetical protein
MNILSARFMRRSGRSKDILNFKPGSIKSFEAGKPGGLEADMRVEHKSEGV